MSERRWAKRRKPDLSRFLLDLVPACFRLAAELANECWRPDESTAFYIREPKPRMISAAPICDRVAHHAIVSLLEPHFEWRFVAHIRSPGLESLKMRTTTGYG